MTALAFPRFPLTRLINIVRVASSFAFLCLLTSGIAVADPTDAPKAISTRSAEQWRATAIHDIEDAYRITVENHPGVFDPANPDFMKNLDAAKKSGLSLAAKVNNADGYVAAVQRFNAGVHDGHAGLVTTSAVDGRTPERWPGFVTAWRGDALYVYATEVGGPAVGARVTACDGKPINDLIADNVFAFRGLIEQPGHWWTQASYVFFDEGNPFIKLPQRCKFAAGNDVREQTLTWKPITEQAINWRNESYNGTALLPVGLTEPRAKLFWVAMPTFVPNEAERDVYRAMYEEISTHRQRYLDADAMVVDLRLNQGGSSMWSRDFAEALWGKGRVERRTDSYFAKTETWWRASADNTKYVNDMVDKLISQKRGELAESVRGLGEAMKESLERGDKFFVGKNSANEPLPANPNDDVVSDPPPFTKPLYVIVPGQCVSACLDALDVFTRFPNTVLIGAPSAADSTYSEVRLQALDSGLAVVIIPNKVYVNRPRVPGQFYTPAIVVNDLNWSTDVFRNVVESDLKKLASR